MVIQCQCPLHHHLSQGKLNYDYDFVVKPSSETSFSILFLNYCVRLHYFDQYCCYMFLFHG